MGQTLSNGVYLPNEGERNCYAGLASNWQILNTAVGNIAEKAPLVHTHGNITNDGKVGTTANLPLITGTGGAVQAGSFGNTANTFCEGNDSRLSDARTPVAHTHTKSDVTDLLNSDFIPSANNSYNLGSSSNQWNKIYSADVVHTSGTETITGVKTLVDYWRLQAKNLKAGEGETYGRTGYSVIYTDKNAANMGDVTLFKNANAARTFIRIRGGDYYTNGAPAAAGTLVQSALMVGTNVSGEKTIECDSDIVYPTTGNATDLGTSTNKWKSLNGINPGALSLPNVRAAVADPISTVGWNLSGSRNKYTPTEDGWFYIRVAGTGSCAINIHNGDTDNSYPTWFNTSTGGYATLVVPCEKGISLYIYISATSIEYCSFHPCLGNV